MSASESSSVALGLPRPLNTSADRTTAAPPSRLVSSAAIGFPSASTNLYHLHAALAALLPGQHDSSGGDPSHPLPLASLHHSRAFLLDLKRQADGAAGSSSTAVAAVGTSRSGLWQTEQERTASQSAPVPNRRHRGEARALGDSLDALPAHWKLHNAFCSRCVGVVIPGITASSLVGEGKGKQREIESDGGSHKMARGSQSKQATRKRKSGRPGSSDGPPLVCLLCQTMDSPSTTSSKRRKNCQSSHSEGSLALKSYAPLTNEEQVAQRTSLGKFPSVRRRDAGKKAGAAKQERRPPSAVVSLRPEMEKSKAISSSNPAVTKSVKADISKTGEADITPKTSLQPVLAAPSRTMPLASPAPRSKQPTQDASTSSYSLPSSLPNSTATASISKAPAKVAPATASPPSLPFQAGQGSSKKKDHKAALRAMLAKGDTAGKKGKKDKAAEGSASGSSGGGGGGGGLKDFLAGL